MSCVVAGKNRGVLGWRDSEKGWTVRQSRLWEAWTSFPSRQQHLRVPQTCSWLGIGGGRSSGGTGYTFCHWEPVWGGALMGQGVFSEGCPRGALQFCRRLFMERGEMLLLSSQSHPQALSPEGRPQSRGRGELIAEVKWLKCSRRAFHTFFSPLWDFFAHTWVCRRPPPLK